jgi:Ca2+-binding RTX toxin-like protein
MPKTNFTLNAAATGFLLDPSSPDSGLVGTTINNLPVWTAYQTAAHIVRPGNTWVDFAPGMVVTYSFGVGVTLPAGYEAFAAADAQDAARRALKQYAETSGLTFIEAGDPAVANITFMFGIGSTNGGGWANYPSASGFVQVGHVSWEPSMAEGTYPYNLLLHETGHAMGLAHPGTYNGDTAQYSDADHFNDSDQYTNMSYWDQSVTGANFSDLSTLGLHDILALQIEYGANWSTRNTDTVYGYNATTESLSYDFEHDNNMGFSIWDGGGKDRLDFSGFYTNTVMDLREGSFSSTGISTHNVSIAYGSVIENATGGSGSDRMLGNASANELLGGKGNDVIFGGSETPVTLVADPRNFTGLQMNSAPEVRNQYATVSGVTALSGGAFTFETMIHMTRVPGSAVEFASYNVSFNDDQFILQGQADGNLALVIAKKAALVTNYSITKLVDGNPHRLSVTWEKATGGVKFYVDGTLVYEGVYTAAIGATIGSGGVLVIGQEQDSLGGGFNAQQVYQGVIGDIRIFNNLRTAQEVSDSAFVKLTGAEQGLVHNWQASVGDTTSVKDVAVDNPSVDLTSLMPAGTFTASQSSNYNTTLVASQVLDNLNTTFSHTLNGGNEWLRLNFSQPLSVDGIQIINRDSNGARLNGATVSVLDANGVSLFTSAPITGASSGATISIPLPQHVLGSAVIVNHSTNYIQIAELNVFGDPPAGVVVPPALVNTDLQIVNGAAVVATQANIEFEPDNDVIVGGGGADALYGGASNDVIYGDLQSGSPQTGGVIDLVRLNANFNASTMGGGFADHSLDQTQSFALPATQFTFEMMMQLDAVPGWFDTLIGYTTGDEWSAQAFSLRGGSSKWELTVDDITVTTDVTMASFVTEDAFRLSITWDKATGTYEIYRDGTKIDSGTVAAGAVLPASGNLFVATGWDSTVKGAFGDIRVWNSVRSEAAINDTAFSELASPATEPGLVANWQVGATGTLLNAASQPGVAALVVQNVKAANPLELTTVDFTQMNADQLFGGEGNDTLHGGESADTLNGGSGADMLDGGADVDTVSYADNVAGVNVLLKSGVTIESAGVADTLVSIENVVGSQFNDTIQGNATANVLDGADGRDTINYYLSEAGVTINLTTLAVGIGGDAAGDLFISIENILGSNTGDDVLTGDAGTNFFNGNGGNDTLVGGASADSLHGGEGDDTFDPGTGFDYVNGGGGIDTLDLRNSVEGVGVHLAYAAGFRGDALGDGIAGVENVKGTNLSDIFYGDTAGNVLEGYDGIDEFHGSAGADIHDGNQNRDTSYYRTSVEGVTVTLSNSGASIVGLGGDATGDIQISIENIIGSDLGNDTLTGNDDANFFNGNGGADVLDGRGGNDSLFGGFDVATVDTFVFTGAGFGFDSIGDFVDGVDLIVFQGVPGVTSFDNLTISQLNAALAFVGVNGDANSGITVQGNGSVTLTASDFVFG